MQTQKTDTSSKTAPLKPNLSTIPRPAQCSADTWFRVPGMDLVLQAMGELQWELWSQGQDTRNTNTFLPNPENQEQQIREERRQRSLFPKKWIPISFQA